MWSAAGRDLSGQGVSLGRAGRCLGKGHGRKCGRGGGGGRGPAGHQLSRRRVGGAEPHPPARSFLLTATWHLMHFFILRAHSAEKSAVGWGRTTWAHPPGPPTHPRTRCGAGTARTAPAAPARSTPGTQQPRAPARRPRAGSSRCWGSRARAWGLGPRPRPPVAPCRGRRRLERGPEAAGPPPHHPLAHRKRWAQP